ncbi:hypothetical protein PGB90_007313 [Kerria lacca]
MAVRRKRLVWLMVLAASIYGAVIVMRDNWKHYNENPTVIVIQKNYREWNITFPAATFCFMNNLNRTRAKQFIYETWNVESNAKNKNAKENVSPNKSNSFDSTQLMLSVTNATTNSKTNNSNINQTDDKERISKYRYYLNFLRNLVNTTYETLNVFEQYTKDETLLNLNITKTILRVMRVYNQNFSFYAKEFEDRQFFLTPMEMGMCYTHGGKLADYISLDRSKIKETFQLSSCNFANTLCYAKTEGTPSDVRYYIHSPYEIPDISSPWFIVRKRTSRDVTFTILETTASSDLYDLTPSQRKCRFMFEPTAPHMQVYSYNLCRMQCRKEIAFKLCGCAPYFYMKEDYIPVCGIRGLACLSQYAQMLILLKTDKGKHLQCTCLPQCIDQKYFLDKDVTSYWLIRNCFFLFSSTGEKTLRLEEKVSSPIEVDGATDRGTRVPKAPGSNSSGKFFRKDGKKPSLEREKYPSQLLPSLFNVRFRWAIEKYNKIRLQRDEIFSFEDLIGNEVFL